MKFILHEVGIRINDRRFGPNQIFYMLLQYHRRFKGGFITYKLILYEVTPCYLLWKSTAFKRVTKYLFIYANKNNNLFRI